MTEKQELNINPDRLRGEQIANLVKEVFEKYPFEITQKLVDSNVVLTLAGLKGQTEFFIDVPDVSKDELIVKGIEDLNHELHARDSNLGMRLQGEPFEAASDKVRTFAINVINLAALKEAISKTKLCDLPQIDNSKGFEAFDKWVEDVTEKYDQESKELQMVVGVIKGYPDQAVEDHVDWLSTGGQKELQDANISYTGIYQEAEPVYEFYPEHADDPEIVENIHRSSEVLAGFYESQWHREIAPSLSFKKGRNSEKYKQ